MPTNNTSRAKLFIPFDALKGFREILSEKEKIVVEKRILSEDDLEELNRTIHTLEKGMIVEITYYDGKDYIYLEGVLSKIDLEYSKYIQIVKQKIPLECIVNIKIVEQF
ncbi:MAG: YolD-like family protein [Bacillota bacterium]|nr:YolD-like family protein [Bacillota bacterium]